MTNMPADHQGHEDGLGRRNYAGRGTRPPARPYAQMLTNVLKSLVSRAEIYDPETGEPGIPCWLIVRKRMFC